MKRNTHSIADYSDYSEFYDRVYGSGANWIGNSGSPIMPQELVITSGYFEKWSHELRLSTPEDQPVRATVGLFIERQLHDIWQQYIMPGYGFTNPYGWQSQRLRHRSVDPGLRQHASGSPTSSASTGTRRCSPRSPGTSTRSGR